MYRNIRCDFFLRLRVYGVWFKQVLAVIELKFWKSRQLQTICGTGMRSGSPPRVVRHDAHLLVFSADSSPPTFSSSRYYCRKIKRHRGHVGHGAVSSLPISSPDYFFPSPFVSHPWRWFRGRDPPSAMNPWIGTSPRVPPWLPPFGSTPPPLMVRVKEGVRSSWRMRHIRGRRAWCALIWDGV